VAIDRLQGIIDRARAVLDRLEQGEKLSSMLSQARVVAELSGDRRHVHWLDFEIYGVGNVPSQKTPLQTAEERAGFEIFWDLHAVKDPRSLTVDQVLESWTRRADPDDRKDSLDPSSVAGLERTIATWTEPDEYFRVSRPDTALQMIANYSNKVDSLQRARDYLHRFVSDVWISAKQERDNIELLGPDYRLIVDDLNALGTGVGNELLSALGLNT